MSTVADRYAKSLLEVSVEQNKLEAIYNDMRGFKETLDNKDLIQLLKSTASFCLLSHKIAVLIHLLVQGLIKLDLLYHI